MTAVVTGAARGIGLAIAHRLGALGHRIVAVDLAHDLAAAVDELEFAGISVIPVQVDLTQPDGPDQVAGASDEVSVLVNNAGITRDARLVNLTEEDVRAVLDVNLGAVYRLTTRLAPIMDSGSIVNVSSRSYLGNFGQFNYSMSKGGVVGMTRAMAISLAPRVRVNAVAPGLIGTEMVMGIPDDIRTRMVEKIPMGRMGRPAEVADVVGFLASEESSYVTGQVIVIGGGRSFT